MTFPGGGSAKRRASRAEPWYCYGVSSNDPTSNPEPATERTSSKSDDKEASGSDVVLVHGVTPDGEGLEVIRRRQGRLEAGAARPLKQGQPIAGEVVRLKPRKEFPLLCDVEVEVSAPAPVKPTEAAPRKGPPRVSTQRYRDNWDAIWSAKRPDETLLN